MARRGTWLLLLLALFAAQLGIIRPAAASPRDTGASTVELRSGTPALQARRDPPTVSRQAAQQIDPPDALTSAPRWSLPRAVLVDVVLPDDLVGTSSTRHRGGCASPRGPPSFER